MEKQPLTEKPTPRIDGDGWSIWLGAEYGTTWEFAGNDYKILKMVFEEFGPDRVANYSNSSTEFGRPYGMLYEHVAEFLVKSGFKAETVGLPPCSPEVPPQ